jgi:hypothetical protein
MKWKKMHNKRKDGSKGKLILNEKVEAQEEEEEEDTHQVFSLFLGTGLSYSRFIHHFYSKFFATIAASCEVQWPVKSRQRENDGSQEVKTRLKKKGEREERNDIRPLDRHL